jgi:hypothetical protein
VDRRRPEECNISGWSPKVAIPNDLCPMRQNLMNRDAMPAEMEADELNSGNRDGDQRNADE